MKTTIVSMLLCVICLTVPECSRPLLAGLHPPRLPEQSTQKSVVTVTLDRRELENSVLILISFLFEFQNYNFIVYEVESEICTISELYFRKWVFHSVKFNNFMMKDLRKTFMNVQSAPYSTPCSTSSTPYGTSLCQTQLQIQSKLGSLENQRQNYYQCNSAPLQHNLQTALAQQFSQQQLWIKLSVNCSKKY